MTETVTNRRGSVTVRPGDLPEGVRGTEARVAYVDEVGSVTPEQWGGFPAREVRDPRKSAKSAPDLTKSVAVRGRDIPVSWVRTGDLVPHAQNARTHSAAQVTRLAASIREFGFTAPILTDGKLGVLAGHGRLMAALQLGMDTVPTIALRLTAKQRKAYLIADNQLALNGAGWDEAMLGELLTDLRDQHFDLALTGFEGLELADLLGEAPEPEERAPRVPVASTNEATCPHCGGTFRV